MPTGRYGGAKDPGKPSREHVGPGKADTAPKASPGSPCRGGPPSADPAVWANPPGFPWSWPCIIVLDRAKGRLQAERGLSEPEAFRWIQKTSMNRRVSMRAVAEAVLAGEMPEDPAGGGGAADADGR